LGQALGSKIELLETGVQNQGHFVAHALNVIRAKVEPCSSFIVDQAIGFGSHFLVI
jgi:hypothetical protein